MVETSDRGFEMGNVSNTASEASELDLGRVTESMAKAGQIKGQIKQMQQQNAVDAYLLSIIFKYVESEQLLRDVFTFVIHQHISIRVIFVYFLPFLYTKIDTLRLGGIYRDELALLEQIEIDLVRYVGYCKQMRQRYPAITDINDDKYLGFLREVMISYGLVIRSQLDVQQQQQFDQTIRENIL